MKPCVEGQWVKVDDHLVWNWSATAALQTTELHRLFAEHLEQTQLSTVSLEPSPKG